MARLQPATFILGLDIGIGSVGWAVIRDQGEHSRIEDFGVRIFDSGESNQGKDRPTQERRHKRSARRVTRRRSHRRKRLKHYLGTIGLTNEHKLQAYYESNNPNIYEIRTRGLYEKLSGEEITAALINICNRRGYRDFYEDDKTDVKQQLVIRSACENVHQLIEQGNYKTIGEMFFKDPAFRDVDNPNNPFPFVRNKGGNYRFLVERRYLESEVEFLLAYQAQYHSCLNTKVIERVKQIIFSQRDFEDGPGMPPPGKTRRYSSFLDSIGKCPFYKEEKRGFRNTIIADLFSLINVLSQYSYVIQETGEIDLPREAATAIIEYALNHGRLTAGDLRSVLAEFGVEVTSKEKATAPIKALQFIPKIKTIIEQSGSKWTEWITEEQLNLSNPSRLHLLAEVLSKFQTPRRKGVELAKLEFLEKPLFELLKSKGFSGTSGTSYRYMVDAINAFLNGETYGNFQARRNQAMSAETKHQNQPEIVLKLPPITDHDLTRNAVVFRSINETRKIVNAILEKYGNMSAINVEVARDLGRSYEQRREIIKRQDENEKEKQKIIEELQELFPNDKISVPLIDRYRLYKQQQGKCLYSGRALDINALMTQQYEIDHIVPYSLILDNTLHNKALVYATENQNKRQRVPLEYIIDPDRISEFKNRVTELYKKGKISQKKYGYLMLPSLNDTTVIDEWKSRNINDTRYITRYIVNYLQKNLNFNSSKTRTVNGIRGAITSRFRRLWLQHTVWGDEEKNRISSHLHHAVDAIIVANLTPAYIEIASDYLKLTGMKKRNKGRESVEYIEYLNICLEKMKNYGFIPEYTERLLRSSIGNVPTIVPNLRQELCIRLIDNDEKEFQRKVRQYYHENDCSFIESLSMPKVSYKPNRRYRGTITKDNAIRLIDMDGEIWQVKRISVEQLRAEHVRQGRLMGHDGDLLMTLEQIFEGRVNKYNVADFLKEQGVAEFRTLQGRMIKKVSIREKWGTQPPGKKMLPNRDITLMDAGLYYCVEVYKTKSGKTSTRGIRYIDLVKQNKQLFLVADYPESYSEHIAYLFTNDYIRIYNQKNQLKFEGNYRSVKNINKSLFRFHSNIPYQENNIFSIAQGDTVKKFEMDILGKVGGEIHCGGPLLSVQEKK